MWAQLSRTLPDIAPPSFAMRRFEAPYPASQAIVGIGFGLILSIITCGIYFFVWEYRQMKTLNAWLEKEEFDFVLWLVLSIVTCGLFSLYYEYKMARAINRIQHRISQPIDESLPVISLLLSVVGLPLVSTAIQQGQINEFYDDIPAI